MDYTECAKVGRHHPIKTKLYAILNPFLMPIHLFIRTIKKSLFFTNIFGNTGVREERLRRSFLARHDVFVNKFGIPLERARCAVGVQF